MRTSMPISRRRTRIKEKQFFLLARGGQHLEGSAPSGCHMYEAAVDLIVTGLRKSWIACR